MYIYMNKFYMTLIVWLIDIHVALICRNEYLKAVIVLSSSLGFCSGLLNHFQKKIGTLHECLLIKTVSNAMICPITSEY